MMVGWLWLGASGSARVGVSGSVESACQRLGQPAESWLSSSGSSFVGSAQIAVPGEGLRCGGSLVGLWVGQRCPASIQGLAVPAALFLFFFLLVPFYSATLHTNKDPPTLLEAVRRRSLLFPAPRVPWPPLHG